MTVTARRHGPSLRASIVPLGRCEICQGKGFIKGIFHEMACAGCNGAGLVMKESGEALENTDMISQLRLRLNGALALTDHLRKQLPEQGGPAADYLGMTNKHHRGGGHWVGD